MAITVVGTPPQPNIVDNTSTTAPLGGTTAVNDLVLAYYGYQAAAAASVTNPLSGYTNAEVRTSAAQAMHLDYKVAGASEAAPAVTRGSGSAGDRFFGAGIILRGANTSSPIHATVDSAATKTAGVLATPALTITEDNTFIVLALVLNAGTTGITAFGAFLDWTQITPVFHSASTMRTGVVAYYKIQTTAASIPVDSIAVTGGDNGGGARMVMVAISQASSGSAPRSMYYHLSGMH